MPRTEPTPPAAGWPPAPTGGPGAGVDPPVEVRRSRRRTRTVSAWREGGRTVVAIPARFTRAQEREWTRRMLGRLEAQDRRRRPSDAQLAARATALSARYLGARAVPSSVAWSSRQGRRWGSCTPADGSIRLSDRLRGLPRWVVDYVLLHELVHLLHAGHGPEFWRELDAYPGTDRARGFLEGYAHAVARGEHEPVDGPPDDLLDDEPGDGGLADDEPLHDEPIDDEPIDDEPIDDEPIDDEPLHDEPIDDGPADDAALDDAGRAGLLFC